MAYSSDKALMKIIPYHQTETVEFERMYVCGNLHRLVIEPWERDANGTWQPYRDSLWFDSMSKAVVWAISKGLRIGNWDECAAMLEMESAWQHAYEEWMRAEMVRQILPSIPVMIGCVNA